MKPSSLRLIPILLLCTYSLSAQNNLQKVTAFRKTNEQQIIEEYLKFVAIPDETDDSANIRLNAAYIIDMLAKRGVKAELLKPAFGNPVVFGEVNVPGATKTINFYAHYDGQPVNPKQWAAGLKPFDPVFITKPIEQGGTIINYQPGMNINPDWRISGRASADDKASIMCIINAYDALVKSGITPNCNLKFFFEGEEEKSSPHLAEIFRKYKDKLASDVWIICDGPRHISGKKMIVFGVRGDVNMRLTVYGPKRPLHSGNYGNWAPNPGLMLAQLLAGMKDDKGHVTIKGFYDDVIPPSETEKAAIKKIPSVEADLKKDLGIAEPEGGDLSLIEGFMQPSLNINGMASGNVGSLAANVIPVKAEAVLDLRLVLGNDVDRQVQKVTDYIKAQGYYVIDREPTDEERQKYGKIIKVTQDVGYNAQRTPMDMPIAQSVIKAVQSTVEYPVVLTPTMGGSLPLFVFEKELGAKVITMPLVNYDNNQHAENENVKISFLWEGIETIAAIMEMR
ncbi:MAG TPA: M20/M25/M40 family metallo-hydrolase [Mucilaginibacter sp.]|jgi:acetylornithine deacetylase/succinyl-diaminopimelate desuccinylase-like protein